MYLKKIILPVLGLFILSSISNASFNWETHPDTKFTCIIPGTETKIPFFQFIKTYIDQPNGSALIKDCCESKGNRCWFVKNMNGDNIYHAMTFKGDVGSLEWLGKLPSFDPDEGQWMSGQPFRMIRSGVMYSSEQGKKDMAEALLKIGANPNLVSVKDQKTAYDLTKDPEIKALLKSYMSDAKIKSSFQDAVRFTVNFAMNDKATVRDVINHLESLTIWGDLNRALNYGNRI